MISVEITSEATAVIVFIVATMIAIGVEFMRRSIKNEVEQIIEEHDANTE